jgi:hypothetical protein
MIFDGKTVGAKCSREEQPMLEFLAGRGGGRGQLTEGRKTGNRNMTASPSSRQAKRINNGVLSGSIE